MSDISENSIIKIFSDGGARGNPGPGAAAFVVIVDGDVYYEERKYLGVVTNNIAEYTAILMATEWLKNNKASINAKIIHYFVDSLLAANQLLGVYKIRDKGLLEIFLKIKKIQNSLPFKIAFQHIPREKNKYADCLVNVAIDEN